MPTIQEIAKTTGFKGTANHKIAEPDQIQTLPVIDNSVPTQSNIRTSIDCYVSGQYVQRGGKVIEVTQRYTIFVSYARSSQTQTMNEVRDRVVSDFQSRYGNSFQVTTAFVPSLPVPKEDILPGTLAGGTAPLEIYGGTNLFRRMTEYERLRYDVGTEKTKSRSNIESLRKRYKMR